MFLIFEHDFVLPTKKAKTNSVDPDQAASEEAVWSGFSMFTLLKRILLIPTLISNILFENSNKSVQNYRTFTIQLFTSFRSFDESCQ